MMYKTILRPFLIFLVYITCFLPYANAASVTDSLLWKISKQGQPDSYLIGTLHLGRVGSKLPAEFQAALNNSATLVLETRSSPQYLEQHPQETMKMLNHYMHSKSLHETVGNKRLQAAKQIYAKSPLSSLNEMLIPEAPIAPWVVWFHFSYALVPEGYDFEHGIDIQLEHNAEKQGKQIVALEHDEAIIMVKQLPEDIVIRAIDAALANQKRLRQDNRTMFRLYQQRRLAPLWEKLQQSESLSYGLKPADARVIDTLFYEQLLKQRNLNWLPKIVAMLPQKSHTIAVGAAHLPGENGLIVLLRQQGYQVEPVKMK